MIEYTLRQLEVFTAATEQESLTRAADQLHLTQSTASTHLRSLEQSLGTTLLLRRGQGGVTLTEDGQRLYPLAKKILAQCQALADAAGDPGGLPPCRFCWGHPPCRGSICCQRSWPPFAESIPNTAASCAMVTQRKSIGCCRMGRYAWALWAHGWIRPAWPIIPCCETNW